MTEPTPVRIRAFETDDANALVDIFRSSVRVVARRDYTLAQVTAWAPDDIDVNAWPLRCAKKTLSSRRSMPRSSDSATWSPTATSTCCMSTHSISVRVSARRCSHALSLLHGSRDSLGSSPSRALPHARSSSIADFACAPHSWFRRAAKSSSITEWRKLWKSEGASRANSEVFDTQCIRAPRPSWAGKRKMVEAGGQLTRSFHCGLDYAFILAGHPASMRSVLSGRSLCSCLILVLALNPGHSRRVYESLQGRPEVGPLPTPRRCHATVTGRCRQVSPM